MQISILPPEAVVRNHVERIWPETLRHRAVKFYLSESGYPYGFSHPDVLADITGGDLDAETQQDLRMGYVSLCAYYFLLDSIIDSHLENITDAVHLTPLISSACLSFVQVCKRLAPNHLDILTNFILTSVGENSAALSQEKHLWASPLEVSEHNEFESIIGRSNAFILLYKTLCLVTDKQFEPEIESLLKDLLFYFQLADDIGDWREDYRAGRFSSFLRHIFFSQGRLLDEQRLDEQVYLGGFFEAQTSKVIRG